MGSQKRHISIYPGYGSQLHNKVCVRQKGFGKKSCIFLVQFFSKTLFPSFLFVGSFLPFWVYVSFPLSFLFPLKDVVTNCLFLFSVPFCVFLSLFSFFYWIVEYMDFIFYSMQHIYALPVWRHAGIGKTLRVCHLGLFFSYLSLRYWWSPSSH